MDKRTCYQEFFKKNLLLPALAIAGIFTLSSCSSGAASATPSADPNVMSYQQYRSAEANARNGSGGQGRMFMAGDLVGQVSAINGNTVTVKVIQMPQPGASGQGGGQNGVSGGSGRNSGNGGQAGSGQNGGGQNRANRGGGGQNGGGFAPETITLADIKTGDIISVWYSDPEKKTVSRVNVTSFGGQGGPGQNGSGQNSGAQSGSGQNGGQNDTAQSGGQNNGAQSGGTQSNGQSGGQGMSHQMQFTGETQDITIGTDVQITKTPVMQRGNGQNRGGAQSGGGNAAGNS